MLRFILWLLVVVAGAACADGSPVSCSMPAASASEDSVQGIVSAIREPDEDWEAALDRETRRFGDGIGTMQATEASARSLAVSYSESFDISHLPDWTGSQQGLEQAFRAARDERVYTHPSRPEFLRRTPWLYPIDGCFVRAAHVAQSLARQNFLRPGKVYAFGRLRTKTDFTSRGWAYWSYHVAAAYEFEGQAWVFDVTVDASRPLTFQEWVSKISRNPSQVRVAICDSHSYMPSQRCRGATDRQERGFRSHQRFYHQREWNSLRNLRKNPEKLLGEEPPWKSNLVPVLGEGSDIPASNLPVVEEAEVTAPACVAVGT